MIKVLINGSLKREARAKFLTCKIMLVLLSKGVYFPQLNQTLMIFIKQAPNLNMEEIVLEILTEFTTKARLEDLMNMVEFGLIMELGDWKQCF